MKIKILKVNQHCYAVAVLCRCLGISRHYVYNQYKATKQKSIANHAEKTLAIFNRSYQSYQTRRIRFAL